MPETKDAYRAGQSYYHPTIRWMVEDPDGDYDTGYGTPDYKRWREDYQAGPEYKTFRGAVNWIIRQTRGETGDIYRADWTADSFYDDEYGMVGDATVEHEFVAYAYRVDGEWVIEKEE